jgi:hypothetical protein
VEGQLHHRPRDLLRGLEVARVAPREALAGQVQLARAAAQQVAYDLPDDYYARFVPSVRAVDQAAVTSAARQWLRPDDATVIVVGDRAHVGEPLERLGVAPLLVEEGG